MYPEVYLCVIYLENRVCNNHVVIMYCFHLHWDNLHAHKAGSITMIKKSVNITVSWSRYTLKNYRSRDVLQISIAHRIYELDRLK